MGNNFCGFNVIPNLWSWNEIHAFEEWSFLLLGNFVTHFMPICYANCRNRIMWNGTDRVQIFNIILYESNGLFR